MHSVAILGPQEGAVKTDTDHGTEALRNDVAGRLDGVDLAKAQAGKGHRGVEVTAGNVANRVREHLCFVFVCVCVCVCVCA